MPGVVYLKPSRVRLEARRHPWVRKSDVARVEGRPQDGDAVEVQARDGRFLAHGLYNGGSFFRVRLVSFREDEPIAEGLLRARLRGAVALRHDVLRLPERGDGYRLVNSEGDGLPGLVVDRYGEVLVVACSSLGLQRRLEPLLDELEELLAPAAIVEVDPPGDLCTKEGLAAARGVVRGTLPAAEGEVLVDGLRYGVAYAKGQKTGLFFDQRENVARVAELARGRRVLDACCYAGGFGLACARAGAKRVLLFDASEEATARARANAERNGLAGAVEVRRASLFPFLRELAARGERFDLVVLDPPKFVPARKALERGRRGYVDANRLALELLAPGGLLFTCSCSHHMSPGRFADAVREAAARADLSVRVLEERGAGPDHPLDLHCPEGRYLKGLLLQRS